MSILYIFWPIGGAVPKLRMCPQIMLVITLTKFGQNLLKHCGDIPSCAFLHKTLLHSSACFMKLVWCIKKLLIHFCQNALKMIWANFDKNWTNRLGRVRKRKFKFAVVNDETVLFLCAEIHNFLTSDSIRLKCLQNTYFYYIIWNGPRSKWLTLENLE